MQLEAQKTYKSISMLNVNLEYMAMHLTEASAIACYDWIGKGQEKEADHAAVEAMRQYFNTLAIEGTIVIGEGERDKAPMLYIGEKLGKGGEKIDIAVDPLEGTTICANAAPNSISVIAFAESGCFLHAPDVYMEKIAVGAGLPEGIVDLDAPIKENLKNLAKAKDCTVRDLTVCILKRPRHEELIAKVREIGAKIQLIADGDVTAVIATCMNSTGVDMYIGTGGAPEGVIGAAALKALRGQMQGRLLFKDAAEEKRARDKGIKDLSRKYNINDMAQGDVIFAATGVTYGWFLDGVKWISNNRFSTHSVIMHSGQQSVKYIKNQFSVE
jgi:fructose-1,6-bisphosphatase II / sedoheptulose-1,7-bisphosphatase